MAHKVLDNGTAYEITGGKVLDNGTAYEIDHGRVMDAGTVYDIAFAAELISFTLYLAYILPDALPFQAEEGMTWSQFCRSNYNTGGSFIVDNGFVKYKLDSSTFSLFIDWGTSTKVNSSEVIIAGHQYQGW